MVISLQLGIPQLEIISYWERFLFLYQKFADMLDRWDRMRIIQRLGNSIKIQNSHLAFSISPKGVTHRFQVLPWAEELEWCMSLGQVFVCVHSAPRSQWGFAGWGLESGWWELGFFSMESESKAICEPSNPLAPRLHPLSTSACSSGTLGVTEPGEKWSPSGEGISLLLGQRERSKEQTRGGRGCVRLCFCRSSLGAGQSTAPLQTFIRVHRVNWNIPAPTALIHSDSFRSFW